jgi:hypothetical protein
MHHTFKFKQLFLLLLDVLYIVLSDSEYSLLKESVLILTFCLCYVDPTLELANL